MQHDQAHGVFHVFFLEDLGSFKPTMIRLLIPKFSGPAGSWSFSSVSAKMSSQRGKDLPCMAWIKWDHQFRTSLLQNMCWITSCIYKSILIHPLKLWILLEGPSVMALWVMESGWTMESPHVAARIQRISATRTRTHHCSGQASGSTRRDHLTISSELFTAVADATVKPETVGGKFTGHKKKQ